MAEMNGSGGSAANPASALYPYSRVREHAIAERVQAAVLYGVMAQEPKQLRLLRPRLGLVSKVYFEQQLLVHNYWLVCLIDAVAEPIGKDARRLRRCLRS